MLSCLANRPMHGYEVMTELGRLFEPAYRPSPGSVYPAVDALETEKLIEGEEHDGRTTYRITSLGEAALEERADALAALELRTGARLGRADSLEPVLARFKVRLMGLSGRVDPAAVAATLDRAAADIEALDGLPTKEAE